MTVHVYIASHNVKFMVEHFEWIAYNSNIIVRLLAPHTMHRVYKLPKSFLTVSDAIRQYKCKTSMSKMYKIYKYGKTLK